VLSLPPLVRDALMLAAGWLKLPCWQAVFQVAVGQGARDLLQVLGLSGVRARA